jgi:hypothetical protein
MSDPAEPSEDFRSQRMDSPEGKGLARRAWDAYAAAANRVAGPVLQPVTDPIARRIAAPMAVDLFGFWLCWHLEGGFEGLRRAGMSRSAIYRRLKLFRKTVGVHPDEFEMPGVSIDLAAYHEGRLRP